MNTTLLENKILEALNAAEGAVDKPTAYALLASKIAEGVQLLLESATVSTTVSTTVTGASASGGPVTGTGTGTGTGSIS